MTDVARWLSTVRGQLELLGLTLGLAVGVAVFLTSQRDFFLQYVGEKYAPAAATAEVQAQALEGAEPTRPLSDGEAEALYELWMQSAEARPLLAQRLVAAAPAVVSRRLERTLAAGSQPQRQRAARLAELAPSPALRDVLLGAARRARAKQETGFAVSLEAAAAASDTNR